MKRGVLLLLVVLLLAGLVVLVLPRGPEDSSPAPVESTEPVTSNAAPESPPESSDAPVEPAPASTPVELDNALIRRCLGEGGVAEDIPLVLADIDRLEPYTIQHRSMQTYRSISKPELEALAVQGDSAAMVVLASHYFLQASGVENLNAADYASGPNQRIEPWREDALETPGMREHFDRALYWYREAALHGRYAALPAIGNLYARAGMDAVDLGWLSQEDFDALTPVDRKKWSPYNVYYEMGVTMMSDAWTGPTADLAEIAGFFNRDAQNEIVDAMLNAFLNDIKQRNLQIQSVEPWDGPPLVDILYDYCPDAFAEDD